MNISTHSPTYRRLDLERDLVPLVTLLKEISQVDPDIEQPSEAELREQLTWAGQDPAENSWVVEKAEGTHPEKGSPLIGWSLLQKIPTDENADLSIYVHPAARRQGIGSHLLTLLLEDARKLNAKAARGYVDIQNQGATLYAQQQGFESVSGYTRMQVSTGHIFPLPELPPGFVVRSFRQIQRGDLFTQALNRSYEGLWGHLQTSAEDLHNYLSLFRPEGIFLLFAPDGALAGMASATLSEKLTAQRGVLTGYIDAPGVVPEYRAVGLYRPLVLTVLHWLLPQGPVKIELESWGDAPQTLALYRELGFTATKEEISYRRTLS